MIKLTCKFSILVSLAILAASCTSKSDNKDADQTKISEAFLGNVETTKSTLSNQKKELTLTGKVEYNPDKVVNYTPLISGVIERTYFSAGDKVQKGQTMLDIKSSDLSSLQSDYTSSESELKIAERELQAAQSMFEDNMLSEKELLEAKAKLKQAQTSRSKLHNDISALGVNKGNGVFAIKSPMSGYVVEKKGTSGSPVSADSEPLFVVADLSDVWIIANVYASNLQAVKEGMDVEITSLSYPGEVFEGKINALSQVFDSEEKVLKARIVMPNQNMKFKPEMSVLVKLKDQSDEKLVSISSDALIFDADRYYVVVEESKDNFVIKEVVLQGHNDKTTYIQSGIDKDENVVTKNQLLIYSGLRGK